MALCFTEICDLAFDVYDLVCLDVIQFVDLDFGDVRYCGMVEIALSIANSRPFIHYDVFTVRDAASLYRVVLDFTRLAALFFCLQHFVLFQ